MKTTRRPIRLKQMRAALEDGARTLSTISISGKKSVVARAEDRLFGRNVQTNNRNINILIDRSFVV